MNLLELEKYLRVLDKAGLLEDEDKEDGGWVPFSQTMLEDVNSGSMDSFVFILMKMLVDYKRVCDQEGKVLPNPSAGTGLTGEGDDAGDKAAYATGTTAPVALHDLDPHVRDAVMKRLITPEKPIRKVIAGSNEAYITHRTRKYSKRLAEGRYFVYPEQGRFHMLRGHIARIDKMNKTRMEVTMMTGPASDPNNSVYARFNQLIFPLGLLPSSYFEGLS